MKKISVVMSIYNENIDEIKASIDSILNQTYENIEFIIILDNPTRLDIKTLLAEYQKIDSRIKVIYNQKNEGLALSLNKGLEIATGEYIARMDSDDISLQDRLKIQLEFLEENKNIDLIGSDVIKINEKGQKIGELKSEYRYEKILKVIKYRNCFTHPSIFFRKNILKKIKGYRNFPCAQDYDFLYRIVDNGYRVENLNKKLLKYRVRSKSISVEKRLFQLLIADYIQKLAFERKENNGQDSFSEREIKNIEKIFKEENIKFQKVNELVLKNKENKVKLLFILPRVYFISKYYRKEIHNRIKIFLSTFFI